MSEKAAEAKPAGVRDHVAFGALLDPSELADGDRYLPRSDLRDELGESTRQSIVLRSEGRGDQAYWEERLREHNKINEAIKIKGNEVKS